MQDYVVQISDKAIQDMEKIYLYIAEAFHSPGNALNQYNRIADAILSLRFMPERIKIMVSPQEASFGLRQLFVDNYSVFFVIHGTEVNIVRVLYSASDIARRLKEE